MFSGCIVLTEYFNFKEKEIRDFFPVCNGGNMKSLAHNLTHDSFNWYIGELCVQIPYNQITVLWNISYLTTVVYRRHF